MCFNIAINDIRQYLKQHLPKTIDYNNIPQDQRLTLVNELLEYGSDIDEYFLDFNSRINQVHLDRLTNSEQNSFFRTVNRELGYLEAVSDYVLFTKDVKNCGYFYSERSLKRRYYDGSIRGYDYSEDTPKEKKRKFNVFNIRDVRPIATSKGDKELTDLDWVQQEAYKNGYLKYEPDTYVNTITDKDLMKKIDDSLSAEERKIVDLALLCLNKSEMARLLNTTRAKLDTQLKHIGKKLFPEQTIEPKTKVCRLCLVEKDRNDFGCDGRNKDGLRSYCRLCENSKRKKDCV